MLSFDSYYRDQGHLTPDVRSKVNYDHPDALDSELLIQHLDLLRAGHQAPVPIYDFATHTRQKGVTLVGPAEVIVVEGILLFSFSSIVQRLDYRVFRQCPESIRFARRIKRDVRDRGRSLESVRTQLATTVKPMHDQFVEPYALRAHRLTNHGEEAGDVAVEIVEHVSNATMLETAS